MRRAGLYLRISKDPSGDRLAVERQRRDGEELIARRSWEHVDTYTDNDLSAKGRKQRPEFQRLMADIRSGRIDTTVADRWDRLSRNRRDDLTIVETCQPALTLLAFMRGSDIDLSTASGRLTADIMSAVARNEIEVKSERQLRQAQQAAERGVPGTVGRRAFGYTPDGLHLDPVEAPVVAELYGRWLAGEGLSSLAQWLDGQGWTTPRGNRWTRQNVREVLANPRNGGLRGIREVVDERTGTRAQWHRVVGPAVWPGVVDEPTWRSAMERIRDPNRPGQHAGYNRQKYLLSKLALCGLCGVPLVTGGSAANRLLKCPAKFHISRRADYIEAYVVEVIVGWLRRGTFPQPSPVEDGGVDVRALQQRSVALRAQLDDIAINVVEGVLDRQQARTAGEYVRAQLAELDDRIAAVGRVDPTAGLRAAADPEAAWDALPIGTRRQIIREFVVVRVLPGRSGRPGGVRFDPATVEVTSRTAQDAGPG